MEHVLQSLWGGKLQGNQMSLWQQNSAWDRFWAPSPPKKIVSVPLYVCISSCALDLCSYNIVFDNFVMEEFLQQHPLSLLLLLKSFHTSLVWGYHILKGIGESCVQKRTWLGEERTWKGSWREQWKVLGIFSVDRKSSLGTQGRGCCLQ